VREEGADVAEVAEEVGFVEFDQVKPAPFQADEVEVAPFLSEGDGMLNWDV
jgi:hypothetical protein